MAPQDQALALLLAPQAPPPGTETISLLLIDSKMCATHS